jgi:hypothetical protein
MNNINHRNIRLISEDLTAYDTTIACELPLPKFINDTKKGRLFQKVKTIFESGQSRVTYSEVLVTSLSSVEVVSASPVDAKYSVVK